MTPDFSKPILIWDGECGFCERYVERWKAWTGERVNYEPYQTAAVRYPHLTSEQFQRSAVLIEPDGRVSTGAQAVFRTVAHAPPFVKGGVGNWMYERIPGFAWIAERVYAFIAERRRFFSWLSGWLVGPDVRPATFLLSRDLLLRSLGLIYVIAFLSLVVQIPGLVGQEGILPAEQFLRLVQHRFGADAMSVLPTLAWFNASDGFLQGLAIAGACLAALAVFGFTSTATLAVIWGLYFSLFNIGQDFTSFQWDTMLLEAGFLGIFLAPFRFLPIRFPSSPPPAVSIWLVRLFLLRFMLGSGIVKLASGEPAWRNLTALQYHYETQPLPNPLSWYMHQLPGWYHQLSVAAMLVIELVIPFLVLGPRRLRLLAAGAITILQVVIFLTGNYTFFNLLTIVLCIACLDDQQLSRIYPKTLAKKIARAITTPIQNPLQWMFTKVFAAILLPAGILLLLGQLFSPQALPRGAQWFLRQLSPFHFVNTYGAFAVMTKQRIEVVLEGSNDGAAWLEYEFRYKPGDIHLPPPIVEPHQPRLDWQMWFLPFSSYREQPWIQALALRLLQGSRPVLKLLAKNPFPDRPPKFVRAVSYEYHDAC